MADKIIIDCSTGNYEYVPLTQEELDLLKPDIEEVRNNVIKQISEICNYKIINEFTSNCLGETKHFKCGLEDQNNITGRFAQVQAKEGILLICQLQQRQPTELEQLVLDRVLTYKSVDDEICFEWTNEQIKKLAFDMDVHITSNINRCDKLQIWARNQTDVSVLEGWSWDMNLGE